MRHSYNVLARSTVGSIDAVKSLCITPPIFFYVNWLRWESYSTRREIAIAIVSETTYYNRKNIGAYAIQESQNRGSVPEEG